MRNDTDRFIYENGQWKLIFLKIDEKNNSSKTFRLCSTKQPLPSSKPAVFVFFSNIPGGSVYNLFSTCINEQQFTPGF